jgi:hypothetical protein
MPMSSFLPSAIRPLAFAAAVLALATSPRAQDWVPVTDGKSAEGLTKFSAGTVTYGADGIIRTSGGNGYVRTQKEYTHFRTRIEWNNTGGGNTGFLFHIGEDRVWPLGLECQMMSGDVGSLWTTGCKFNSTGSGNTFNPTGNAITGYGTTGTGRNQFVRSQDPGAAVGSWSTWEMYVKGDSLEITCNNKLVMRVWRISINNGTPLVKGKIGLQIEGASVQWRNWVIQDYSQSTGLAPMRKEIAPEQRLFVVRSGLGRSASAMVGLPDAAGSRLLDLNGRSLRILPVTAE